MSLIDKFVFFSIFADAEVDTKTMDQPKVDRMLRLMQMLSSNVNYSVDDLIASFYEDFYETAPGESFRRRQDNLLSALHGNVPVKLSRITKETVTLSNAFIISAFTVKHFVQHLYNTGRKAPSESDDFCPKQTKKSLSFVA